MGAPSEAADDMAKAADGGEACVQYCATTCVIDEIKAAPAGAPRHIGIDGLAPIIDRHRADLAQIVGIASGTGGEDLGAHSLGNLHGHVSDAARATVHQDLLTGRNASAIHQP